jgi:hypothetical protein
MVETKDKKHNMVKFVHGNLILSTVVGKLSRGTWNQEDTRWEMKWVELSSSL